MYNERIFTRTRAEKSTKQKDLKQKKNKNIAIPFNSQRGHPADLTSKTVYKAYLINIEDFSK